MNIELELQLIASFIAMACAIPGVFLMLRKMSMMADSITHTILLGIVIGFFITKDLSSPLLIIGATVVGVFTVWLTELLYRSKIVSEDSAIGAIFPFLFSIAIILISRYAGSVHLDVDSVLLGELAFAPFDRLIVYGYDIGAKGIYTGFLIFLLNLIFVTLFYKELKLTTFDTVLSSLLGFMPLLLHYALMTMVSITTVVAFQSVGSILVIAYMIGPPITAYLLTINFKYLLILSCSIGCFNSIIGYQLSRIFDLSISGTIATVTGISFLITFLFAKNNGIISIFVRRKKQSKLIFEHIVLQFMVDTTSDTQLKKHNFTFNELSDNFHISTKGLHEVLRNLEKKEYIQCEASSIYLLEKGTQVQTDMY